MPIVRNGQIVEDLWTRLEPGAVPDGSTPVLVSLEHWRRHRSALRDSAAPIGLLLNGDDRPDDVADDLERFDLIALVFPKFTDGRAYSLARLLRQRHGYSGELRAVGNVLRDQFLHMKRCGFDSAEIGDTASVEAWTAATVRYKGFYQPAADGRTVGRPRPGTAQVIVNGAPVEMAGEAGGYTAAAWAY